MTSVSIIDYGVGNLLSVARAFNYFGADVKFVKTPDEILQADRLILPGVGAFADGMRGLSELKIIDPIKEYAQIGKPLLGICLGMQMMLTKSNEFGEHLGLGLIDGDVVSIPKEDVNGKPHNIPHIGWNELQRPREGCAWEKTILNGLDGGNSVYFVHSFMAVPTDPAKRLADTFYNGQRICAAFNDKNIYGCQFHPEKSGELGLKIIKNFLEL